MECILSWLNGQRWCYVLPFYLASKVYQNTINNLGFKCIISIIFIEKYATDEITKESAYPHDHHIYWGWRRMNPLNKMQHLFSLSHKCMKLSLINEIQWFPFEIKFQRPSVPCLTSCRAQHLVSWILISTMRFVLLIKDAGIIIKYQCMARAIRLSLEMRLCLNYYTTWARRA